MPRFACEEFLVEGQAFFNRNRRSPSGGAHFGSPFRSASSVDLSPSGAEGEEEDAQEREDRQISNSLSEGALDTVCHQMTSPGTMAGRVESGVHPEGFEPPTPGSEDCCSFLRNSHIDNGLRHLNASVVSVLDLLPERLNSEELSRCVHLLQVWPHLPQSIRSAILLMIQPWTAGDSSALPDGSGNGGEK